MNRTLAGAVVLAAVLLLAGCSASIRTISAAGALHDLQRAGFTELEIARFTQGSEGHDEIDTIGQRDIALAFLPPVQLIDYPSDKAAIDHYGGPDYVRRQFEAAVRAGQGIVPRDFRYSRKKAYSAQLCNVILWSYNLDNDPRLHERLRRAVRLLVRSCGGDVRGINVSEGS